MKRIDKDCLNKSLKDDPHYQVVAQFYGQRRAQRSRQPLILHIDEGLRILQALGAAKVVTQAFCLHPLLQADDELKEHWPADSALWQSRLAPRALVLAMEYRKTANATLSHREISGADDIPLSPLLEVQQMLIADKVQNRKDFERFHQHSHERAEALRRYFRLWLERLGVSEERYRELCEAC